MRKSDGYLEEALKEYNVKVDEYDDNGTLEQRLEAYLNRGCILSMMDSFISAITDFDEAIEIMDLMGSIGDKIDAGTYVKTYVSRGELQMSDDAMGMVDDYVMASKRLDDLKPNSRHFDEKSVITMSLSCCEDLLDEGYPENIKPFFDKAEIMLFSKNNVWHRNRYVEALNLMGQAEQDMGNGTGALEHLDRSIALAQELMKDGALDDETALVFALTLRGDLEIKDGLLEAALKDREAAIAILEVLLSYHRPETKELLIQMHRETSSLLMEMNETEEAEKHLLRALEINVGEATLSNIV